MSVSAKLYYGSGEVTIDGAEDVVGIQIFYEGAIEIEGTHPRGYFVNANDDIIIIAQIEQTNEPLKNLFKYNGKLKINQVIVVNKDVKKVNCTIKKVMDYSELLKTKSEDLTVNSEDLNASYIHGKLVRKTVLKEGIIKNLDIIKHIKRPVFLDDGEEYKGLCHFHLKGRNLMTGATHSSDSKDLYFETRSGNRLVKIDYGQNKRIYRPKGEK